MGKIKLKCKHCGSPNIVKFGKIMTTKGRKQRYLCMKCGHSTIYPRTE